MATKKGSLGVFECSICCSDNLPVTIRNKQNRLVCPACDFTICVECAKNYGRDDCSNCHMIFKQDFIILHLGKQFIDKVIKPKIVAELMNEQKRRLPLIQPLVEWERNIREQKKNARFGFSPSIPDRPVYNKFRTSLFQCPYDECRGFITDSTCGVCLKKACIKCRMRYEDGHICRLEDIQSLAIINIDCRNCPRCTTAIHRTEGCNHMFCTNCRTHFDWVTGKILKTSTNGHYINLAAYTRTAATLDTPESDDTCLNNEFSIYRDRVPYEQIKDRNYPNDIIQILYIDSNSIRLSKRRLFNEPTLETEIENNFDDLAIKYLLNDISEEQWSKQVYTIHKKNQLRLIYANIINIYLGVIDRLQQKLKIETAIDIDDIRNELRKTIELCNESFTSIQQEYGGNLLKIRNITDSTTIPPIII